MAHKLLSLARVVAGLHLPEWVYDHDELEDLTAALSDLAEALGEVDREAQATPTPYTILEDDRGPRVLRGHDVIGWTSERSDAESFARELNALQAEARAANQGEDEATKVADRLRTQEIALQSRLAKLEAVATAARKVAEAWDADNGSGVLTDDIDDLVGDLNAALEVTDAE